jgi:hypothetical protein
MMTNQEILLRIKEIEEWLDSRPSASMDSQLRKRREMISELYSYRKMVPDTIYNGQPSPMMQAQMQAAESLINKKNEKAF